jgi:hypothetical protein
MDDWLDGHMHAILVGVEILWVAGFLAIFVVYFMIRRRVRADKRAAARQSTDETGDAAPPSPEKRDTKP